MTGLTRDGADLDDTVDEFRYLELEQLRISSGERRETMMLGPFAWLDTSVMTALMRAPCS